MNRLPSVISLLPVAPLADLHAGNILVRLYDPDSHSTLPGSSAALDRLLSIPDHAQQKPSYPQQQQQQQQGRHPVSTSLLQGQSLLPAPQAPSSTSQPVAGGVLRRSSDGLGSAQSRWFGGVGQQDRAYRGGGAAARAACKKQTENNGSQQLQLGAPGGGQLHAQIVLLDFGLAEELTPRVRRHFVSFLNCIAAGKCGPMPHVVCVLPELHCSR